MSLLVLSLTVKNLHFFANEKILLANLYCVCCALELLLVAKVGWVTMCWELPHLQMVWLGSYIKESSFDITMRLELVSIHFGSDF